MKKKRFKNKCNWYLQGFCCESLDAGRAWDCVAKRKDWTYKPQEDCSRFEPLVKKSKRRR